MTNHDQEGQPITLTPQAENFRKMAYESRCRTIYSKMQREHIQRIAETYQITHAEIYDLYAVGKRMQEQ